jgi:hypothetical protein
MKIEMSCDGINPAFTTGATGDISRSTIPSFEQIEKKARTSRPQSTNFSETGSYLGAAVGGLAYGVTYPITFADGPLPVVDAVWWGGFTVAVRKGYSYGGTIGKGLDLAVAFFD